APRGRLAREAPAGGIPVEALPVANAIDVRAGVRLRRLVAGHDVVHFHTARAHALAPFCRGQGARLVVTRRMDYVPRGGPYARWLYNRAVDVVIAISDGVRAALLRAGVDAKRIRVVPSGIDPVAVEAAPGARAAVRGARGAAPRRWPRPRLGWATPSCSRASGATSRRASRRPTSWRFRRCTRGSGWRRSRRWPRDFPWSRVGSGGLGRSWS